MWTGVVDPGAEKAPCARNLSNRMAALNPRTRAFGAPTRSLRQSGLAQGGETTLRMLRGLVGEGLGILCQGEIGAELEKFRRLPSRVGVAARIS